jgi:hypothetical protein
MASSLRELVRKRADHRCEYCRLPESATPFTPFHIEHIVARQHVDDDSSENLALACDRCNAFKGPNLVTIDAQTGEQVNLFHPRRDVWEQHFAAKGGKVEGLTPIGRATMRLLQMNEPSRVALREELTDQPT